jgi:hypothetical protein
MAGGLSILPSSVVIGMIKLIYGHIRPWLLEQVKKSESPVDDWMLVVLDQLLGIER